MPMNRPICCVRTLVAAGLVAIAGFATLNGQPERTPGDDMKALVAEVRALRLAIEQTSVHTSRAQLLLGRVQLQENRLATLGRQYQEARARLLDAQMAQAESEQRLQQVTIEVRNIEDPQERLAIEARIPDWKNATARHQARTAQLQSDETAALDALTTEQQRWSDFNERLGALERALDRTAVPPR
jgi:chromosome segregation ATPase